MIRNKEDAVKQNSQQFLPMSLSSIVVSVAQHSDGILRSRTQWIIIEAQSS